MEDIIKTERIANPYCGFSSNLNFYRRDGVGEIMGWWLPSMCASMEY